MFAFALSSLTVAAIAGLCLVIGCAGTGTDHVSLSAVPSSYTCPLTGEELPCPDCCPLNQEQAEQHAANDTAAASEGYECPLTGEILPCPRCCPLTN